MKKPIRNTILLLCLSCTALFTILTVAQTTPMQTVQHERRSQISKLHSLLDQHFNNKGVITAEAKLTLALLNDKPRQKQFYLTNKVLGLAIDEDHNLKKLDVFGIFHRPDGHYQINLHKHPQWAAPTDLSLALDDKLSRVAIFKLQQGGFNEQDIQRLQSHLTEQPEDVAVIQAQSDFFQHKMQQAQIPPQQNNQRQLTILKTLQHNQDLKTLSLSQAMTLLDQRNIIRFSAQHDWLLGVFALFDLAKQQILLDYLQSRLGHKVIAKAPLTQATLTDLGNRFVSGILVDDMQQKIKSIEGARAFHDNAAAARAAKEKETAQ
ncbi:MAG: hypothetical protein ACI8WB_001844 [Phenylobacterium sp.]